MRFGMCFVLPYVAAVTIHTSNILVPLRKINSLHCDLPTENRTNNKPREYRIDPFSSRTELNRILRTDLMIDHQRVIRAWHQAVLQNMTDGSEVSALDMIPRSEVLEFINCRDSLGFRIRFKPYCQDCKSDCSKDVMGSFMATEPCSSVHQAAAGAIGQNIIEIMCSSGQTRMLNVVPSPHMMIGSYIKEPDMTIRPTGIHIGDGVLDDGFGFPFPTLVVEAAFAESREQLLEDLELWVSPQTSVQVAIGIKIHGREVRHEGRVVDTVEAIEAILLRRNAPAPARSLRFHPARPGARPQALRLHLSDLFFGVARDRLPDGLRQRVARGETVDVDLRYVRERILEVSGALQAQVKSGGGCRRRTDAG